MRYCTKHFFVASLVGMIFWFMGCQSGQQKSSTSEKPLVDTKPIQSYSNPQTVKTEHLKLDLDVNFDKHQIKGKASHKIQTRPDADSFVVDFRQMTIHKVTQGKENETPIDYEIGDSTHSYMGFPLKVDIDSSTQWINIYYTTKPQAGALQWLKPRQTADTTHPFLYTQSQAIYARTWVPCQDAPCVRFTYSAEVEVPSELMALMSAENPVQNNGDSLYQFKMEQPIPSYLLALAVGKVEYKAMSEKTGVYAEPSVIEDAAWEFAKTQEMMDATERLYGPYLWEKYDVIVLPPSFPYGGMENPRLTFLTPTVIAGDRSLTSLIAHELAHSWSGNLVTNATWEDLWINEGFTVYTSRRIMEAVYGKSYANMLHVLGYRHLKESIKKISEENGRPEDTRLHVNLEDRKPAATFSAIPYEKGALFLKTIEETIGRERFDQFLRTYFDSFSFQTMNSKQLVEYMNAQLIKGDSALKKQLRFQEWIHEPGLPDNHFKPRSKRFDSVEVIAQRWKNGKPAVELATSDWSTHEWIYFLDQVPDKLPANRLKELDMAFHFTKIGNYEILADWLELAIRSHYEPAFDRLETFLMNVGRRKFLRPLYSAMYKSDQLKQRAFEIYKKARPGYHAVSRKTLDNILEWEKHQEKAS